MNWQGYDGSKASTFFDASTGISFYNYKQPSKKYHHKEGENPCYFYMVLKNQSNSEPNFQ